jgi:hypothetical protein
MAGRRTKKAARGGVQFFNFPTKHPTPFIKESDIMSSSYQSYLGWKEKCE